MTSVRWGRKGIGKEFVDELTESSPSPQPPGVRSPRRQRATASQRLDSDLVRVRNQGRAGVRMSPRNHHKGWTFAQSKQRLGICPDLAGRAAYDAGMAFRPDTHRSSTLERRDAVLDAAITLDRKSVV